MACSLVMGLSAQGTPLCQGGVHLMGEGTMPDLAMERAHLALAERDIIEGEDRVFRQDELMALMRSQGQNTAEAEALLRVLRETLLVWKAHRDQILRTIASLET